MVTMDKWVDSFDKVASPGDEVDEEIYEYFLNSLPPINWRGGYFQNSEPCSHEKNAEGRYAATYSTFEQREDQYYYLGTCFSGKREHVG